VTTGITGPQRQPVKVDWRVIKADGKLKIVDMIIEGISMDVTWQQDFGAVIQRNGGQIDSLLVALRERIAQQNQSARR
ncbi:MAG: ABC transporter substrate-binding protein, partial [Proteobacteria bacterium]|nr:ABC transporter substrate-binding protein [Pseudomonadota bacterium]